MAEMMKVRIKGGPAGNQITVEDTETGRLLPVVSVEFEPIRLNEFVAAKLLVYVDEIDIEALTDPTGVNTGG